MGRKARITGLFTAAAALAAALAILWPVVGGASPARTAASSTYTDASGDATNGGPDITTVTVSDDSSGKITFTATIGNRPTLTDVDAVQAYFDTDRNAGTGGPGGYDYQVAWIDGHQELDKWDGSQYATQTGIASFTASYKGGQAAFSINSADFGGSTSFNFILTTTGDNGDSTSDRAPDGTANWDFPSSGGTAPPPPPPPPGSPPPPGAPPPPPPPTNGLKGTKFTVIKPHAGGRLTASMVMRVNGTAVKTTVACTAKIGTKKLAVKSKGSVLSGRASCVWTVPKNTKGKTVKATIAATYQGTTVKKSFSAKVLA
jgi:hypothetical protein